MRDLLCVGNLCQSTLTVGITSLAYNFPCPSLFIEFLLLQNVLRSPRHFVLRMNLNKLLVKTETRKGIQKIIAKLFINIFLDFFLQHFKLTFLLKLENILNVPLGGKHSLIIVASAVNGLSDFFVLVVKCLNGSRDVIVGSDSLLHVLAVVHVALLDVVVLLLVAGGGQAECKNCLRLLKLEIDWRLEVLHCQLLLVLFRHLQVLLVLVFAFRF